jgi:hypothetical protein
MSLRYGMKIKVSMHVVETSQPNMTVVHHTIPVCLHRVRAYIYIYMCVYRVYYTAKARTYKSAAVCTDGGLLAA